MIRVGVIDNDKCALEYIISTLRRITINANKSWDIWGSTISTEALQECCNEKNAAMKPGKATFFLSTWH